ncbi:MAG: carbohydrate porin, partial [Succinivibrio sp.]
AASVLAASVLAPAANAAFTPNVNFSGYMRSGVMHGESAFGNKYEVGKVGRLGNENDTFMEFGLGTDIIQVNDVTYSVFGMITHGGDGNEVDWNTNLACRQAYASATGLLGGDDQLWIGKKYYKREDVHIADFYYYNIQGTGVGFENVSLGSGKINLAWTRNDMSYSDYACDDDLEKEVKYELDEYTKDGVKTKEVDDLKPGKLKINTFDVRYEFPVWDGGNIQLGATYLNAEKQQNGYEKHYNYAQGKEVKDGLNLSVEVTQSLLGGFNRTVLQSFSGGSAEKVHWGNGAELTTTEGQGWRLLNFGDVHFTDHLGMFHLVNLGYSSGYADALDGSSVDNIKTVSVIARPYYQLTKMTKVVAEAGFYVEKKKYHKNSDGVQNEKTQRANKFTIAYAIAPDAGNFWSRPEFRFYVTHLNVDNSQGFGTVYSSQGEPSFTIGKKTSDTMFGAQVEAWW